MEVKGIIYEELPGFPGLRTFRCEPLRASLSPESCARNVRRRQNIQCSRCNVGAVHAANCVPQPDEKLEWKGIHHRGVAPAESCARCGTATFRLIRKTICVSCYNREREVIAGANAKGQRPKKAAERLHKATCLIELKGDARLLDLEYCSGRSEANQIIKRLWPGARLVDYEAKPARFGAGKQTTEAPIN